MVFDGMSTVTPNHLEGGSLEISQQTSSSSSSSSSSSAINNRAGQIFSPVDATKPAVR